MIRELMTIIRRNDYSLSDEDVYDLAQLYASEIHKNNYDFSLVKQDLFTQGSSKRVIYSYTKNSIEDVTCRYLKTVLDKYFKVKYANRNKIITTLMNTLPTIKDLNDFVVIKCDFKSFFDSVSTKFVYGKYILESVIPRYLKEIFYDYISDIDYCYAGLSTSNVMTEIACRDFDIAFRASMEKYGVVYCERYVDDVIIILNSYISESDFKDIVNTLIEKTFPNCKVKISNSKFKYIACRNIHPTQSFDYLGYNFTINYDPLAKHAITFLFGISPKKIKKYSSKIRMIFEEYTVNKNIELLRHRVKFFSSRVVFTTPTLNGEHSHWVTKGIIANYNELRNHTDGLDDATKHFLINIYREIMSELAISKTPYFFDVSNSESVYNLFSTMKRNRSLVFDQRIGIKINILVGEIRKLDKSYHAHKKNYYQITQDYFDLLKIQ